MYFPAIGTLRTKYFPDSHRSVVMNLFGIPLNAMVVSVFLSIERLGVQGALGVSTAALARSLRQLSTTEATNEVESLLSIVERNFVS